MSSPSIQVTNRPQKWRGWGHGTVLNFAAINDIVKFCTQVDILSPSFRMANYP